MALENMFRSLPDRKKRALARGTGTDGRAEEPLATRSTRSMCDHSVLARLNTPTVDPQALGPVEALGSGG